MIVTRSWLNEFIDLSGVSNEKLYETFNAIGLEVDSVQSIEIAEKVVIGKILSCEKHPDADKLNVCQIDVGMDTKQIVCGASNVVDAEYVAVATIGAVLPGDFRIKDATLRGVESQGMVCSSAELGLPDTGKGIMILDDSIGTLEVGREFGSYEKVADTIIELELTANRGDCLSVYGVARDLSAALNIEMRRSEDRQNDTMKLGIGREAGLQSEGIMDADLHYTLATLETISNGFLIVLRLAMVNVEWTDKLSSLLAYATHTTGVILRGYESRIFRNNDSKVCVLPTAKAKGIIEIKAHDKVLSVVGINQEEEGKATDSTKELLLEASYIDPDTVVEAFSTASLKSDTLYYKTSRGSNPDLTFGLSYLTALMEKYTDITYYEGSLNVNVEREQRTVIVDIQEISSIVGMEIELSKVITILKRLGFEIHAKGNHVIVAFIPPFRHDVRHIQDISEEVVRIVGINNIEAKPLVFAEKARLNDTTDRYKAKKGFKNRAVGAGFYENVSYLFSEKSLLTTYGFSTLEEELELANPIAEELNTLRSTILLNLLNAVKRNVSYSKKSIPLFEMGAVFDAKREQRDVISFLFSGQIEGENVTNAGKPSMIDFASFTQKIAAVVGTFELIPCSAQNALLHPYQSADIVVDGKVCGFISKLHPTVQERFGIPETFIAELEFDAFLPKHINAVPISKFQGVYKDLSIVIEKGMSYYEVAKVLNTLALPMLKESYPVDIYEDEQLGDKKSLTVRFFIQSMDKTLEEADIEEVMVQIMTALQTKCNAELR